MQIVGNCIDWKVKNTSFQPIIQGKNKEYKYYLFRV